MICSDQKPSSRWTDVLAKVWKQSCPWACWPRLQIRPFSWPMERTDGRNEWSGNLQSMLLERMCTSWWSNINPGAVKASFFSHPVKFTGGIAVSLESGPVDVKPCRQLEDYAMQRTRLNSDKSFNGSSSGNFLRTSLKTWFCQVAHVPTSCSNGPSTLLTTWNGGTSPQLSEHCLQNISSAINHKNV